VACAAQAQSFQQVAPNSNFFANWQFQQFSSTPPASPIDLASGASNTDISLAGRTLTITNESPAGGYFQVRTAAFSDPASLPANIGISDPTVAFSTVSNRLGDDALFTFSQPLPRGTTLFITDLDIDETANIHFLDCNGNPVDASGFTFLQVSVTSPSNPPNYSVQGAAPDRYWNLEGIADNTNLTNGIIIDSDQVCGVRASSARATAATGGSAYIGYFFGMPWVNVNKSVASVNGSAAQTRVSQPQDTVAYSIVINNPGGIAVTLAAGTFQENLPAGVTFASSADFTCAGLSCTNTADVVVPAYGSITLHIAVKVDAGLNTRTTPSLTNVVALPGLDCSAAGNHCSATTVTTLDAAPSAASVPASGPWSLTLLAALLAGCGYAFRRARPS